MIDLLYKKIFYIWNINNKNIFVSNIYLKNIKLIFYYESMLYKLLNTNLLFKSINLIINNIYYIDIFLYNIINILYFFYNKKKTYLK